MKRRATAGRKLAKARPRKAKRRASAPLTGLRSASDALREQLDQSRRELKEALEHQAATSEVLDLISRTPTSVQPVFDAISESAVRLCDAVFGVIWRYDGELLHYAASHNFTPDVLDQIFRTYPKRPDRSIAAGRAILDGRTAHVPDMLADPEYGHELALAGNWRASVAVPMLHEGKVVGAVSIGKAETGPFSPRQIQLLTTFAAQAVIAIENTRLLNELRQRTADLTESLEQQTAPSEVLRVISSSAGDLQPVFDATLTSATQLCEAAYGTMWLQESDGQMRVAAKHGILPEPFDEQWRIGRVFRPNPSVPTARAFATGKLVHVADLREVRSYLDRDQLTVAAVEIAGIRTLISVPMLKGDAVVGALNVYRREVRPFTEKQIELVKNFAAQAVIAIENARLLNELRHRTDDLTESLEQQTATSDVLRVISGSPGELEPVFSAILENAVRLCEATHGHVWRFDGELLHAVAVRGDPYFVEWLRQHNPIRPIAGSAADRIARGALFDHMTDRREEDAYRDNQTFREFVDRSGVRASLAVALRRDETLLGMINVYRQEVGPFTDKQIELVKNFAAQAVIAIENARLLNELRQSLQQQTATADVLKVISRSTFDLQTVLNTLVESATRLCRADRSAIRLAKKDGLYHNVASHGFAPEHKARMERTPLKADDSSIVGRVVLKRKSVHLVDSQADLHRELANRSQSGNTHTLLGVPLQREGTTIGVLLLQRSIVQAFTDNEIALAETFADQAVIAIENVRLFEAEQQRTRELSESLEQQTATAEVLRVISSSPGDLEPVFQTMLENATRICEAKFGTMYFRERDAFRAVAMHGAPPGSSRSEHRP